MIAAFAQNALCGSDRHDFYTDASAREPCMYQNIKCNRYCANSKRLLSTALHMRITRGLSADHLQMPQQGFAAQDKMPLICRQYHPNISQSAYIEVSVRFRLPAQ